MTKELINVELSKGRFKDAPWFQVGAQDIVVIGAGGIGSWLSLFLERAGHHLYIYDNDTFDVSNTAGQFMKLKDIGKNKAVAILENLGAFCDKPTCEAFGKFDENSMVSPIMMCGLDNMATRKLAFEMWCAQEDRILFIDGRQNAENCDIFCIQRGQENRYLEHLFDDSEGYEAPCSYKATSHTGACTAHAMVCCLNNYLSNVFYGIEDGIDYQDIREVPFMIRDSAISLIREVVL